jgi:hypothetical protein
MDVRDVEKLVNPRIFNAVATTASRTVCSGYYLDTFSLDSTAVGSDTADA